MNICHQCKVELRCVKTGSCYHYGNGHVYPADSFQCPNCGITIAVTNPQPSHLTSAQVESARKRLGEWFVEMNG